MPRKTQETQKEMELDEIIGEFVDPTDSKSVQISGNTVVVNTTQISRERIDRMKEKLPKVVEVVEVDYDASIIQM